MVSAIEKPKQWAFTRTMKNQGLFAKETPKLLYSVVIHNRSPKKEIKNNPQEDSELGLPPQPKAYLKYPDCDWF